MENQKIKCYELDFGDTNFISNSLQGILDWIESDIEMLDDKGELNYTITIKYMTQKQYDKLPEWA